VLDTDSAAVAAACRADYDYLAQFRLGSLSE
jgi:hypothetical protein